jgi:hypothetical protein
MFTASVKRTTRRKITNIRLDGRTRVKVGFIGSAQVDKAFYNEFGTAGGASGGGWGGPIPERPFMRTTMRENRDGYRSKMRSKAKDILLGTTGVAGVLTQLGSQVRNDIQATIASGVPPPLSPVTIERKDSSKPLIDTGAMRQGVSWELF